VRAHDLNSAIKKNGIASLYLVSGEEDYLRDQVVDTLKAAVLGSAGGGTEGGGHATQDGGLEAFNYDLLFADESDAAEILSRAGQAPVFAPRRLVLLKAAEKLPAREGEALLPYLKAPCDSTTLVFVAVKLDGRLKFTQALNHSAVPIDCSPFAEPELRDWIGREAGKVGVALNEEAILLLKDLALSYRELEGGSLYRVRRELEKLAAYVTKGSMGGPAEVEAVRGTEPGASVFDLAAAIGARDHGRLLRVLARNLEAGEAPLRILGSLAWQYRRIWRAKDQLRQGGTESEAARMLRMPPFKVRRFLDQFSDPSLQAAFRMFLDTDSKLKGGSAGKPKRVLESLLFVLAAGPAPAGRAAAGAAARPESRPRTPPGTRPIQNGRPVRSGRTSAH